MQCEGDLCVCFEDDVQFATCPAEAACATLDEIGVEGAGCCGFPEIGP